jgi:hypothetical protein
MDDPSPDRRLSLRAFGYLLAATMAEPRAVGKLTPTSRALGEVPGGFGVTALAETLSELLAGLTE